LRKRRKRGEKAWRKKNIAKEAASEARGFRGSWGVIVLNTINSDFKESSFCMGVGARGAREQPLPDKIISVKGKEG